MLLYPKFLINMSPKVPKSWDNPILPYYDFREAGMLAVNQDSLDLFHLRVQRVNLLDLELTCSSTAPVVSPKMGSAVGSQCGHEYFDT